jgi:signal transduction histidine kinase/Tfp pilus assembly protein PilF
MNKGHKISLSLLFISIFLTTGTLLRAQNPSIDSLKNLIHQREGMRKVQLLNDLSREYWQIAPDTSLKYAQQALEVAETLKHEESISDAYNRIGNAYYFLNNKERALDYYQRSLQIREKLGDPERLNQIYNNLGVYYILSSRQEKALEYYKKALEVSKQAGIEKDIASSIRSLAGYYQQVNNPQKAIEYYLQAADQYQNMEDTAQMGQTYMRLGRIYRNISSYDKALKYYLDAIKCLKHANDRNNLADAYNETGIVHMTLDDFDKALEYYNMAIKLFEQQGQEDQIAMIYNNIGIIYDDKNQNEEALEYYQKSLEADKKTNDYSGMASSLNNIGLIYFELEQYPKALEYLNQSLEHAQELDDKHKIANTQNNIGEVLINTRDYDKAYQAINTGLKLANEIHANRYKNESYQLLSKLYEAQGNHKQALAYFKKHHNLNDTIFSKEKQNRISEMQIKYETEKKEKEIELLTKDNQINKLEIKRQKNFKNYVLIFALLLLALAILAYSRFNLKKKNARILQKKNRQLSEANIKLRNSENNLRELNATKDKFFSIIAHDLKNPFHALFGFSEEMYKNIDNLNKEEIREYGKAIHEASQNLYNLLQNLLKWSRTQLGSIVIKPQKLALQPATDEIISLMKINAEEKDIQVENGIDSKVHAYVDQNVYETVVRNLLSNAIKFTNKGGSVKIMGEMHNGSIHVSVSDTGQGIQQEHLKNLFSINNNLSTQGTSNEQGTGLGLILCKELIEKSNGEIWAKSTPGKGSTFKFSLPAQSS